MTRERLLGLFLLGVILLGCLISAASCERSSVAGKYVNQKNTADYLELKSDGTYYLWEDGIGFEGSWRIDGEKITLTWMGFASVGTIEGNRLIDADDEVWLKQ